MNNAIEPRTVIFTDLDGTLLDPYTYSCTEVMPLVTRLRDKGIPLIFCSSKTRAEQEVYQKELGIAEPFIVEDGGAIFVNQGYFPFPYGHHRPIRHYYVIELGIPTRRYEKDSWKLEKRATWRFEVLGTWILWKLLISPVST